MSVSLTLAERNGPWRSLEEVEFATLEWVDWFNNRRLLEPIGDIPPAEFEAMYYEGLESWPCRSDSDDHSGTIILPPASTSITSAPLRSFPD